MNAEIVCRCEEVTADEIMEAIRNGADSLEAVKKGDARGHGLLSGAHLQAACRRMLACYYNIG
jgi:hypothetical protein